jgi:hypothetical protein
MSNYDRIAISHKPDFYFSSNSSSDQSGNTLYTLTNTSTNVGQPIIVGNPSSWRISSTESIAFSSNPIFFREDSNMEFVMQIMQPTEPVCVFGDSDNLNGIFITNTGVEIRFIDVDQIQKSAFILMEKWPGKMHVVITFDSLYCTLKVNEQISQVSYRETDPLSVIDVSFKTTTDNSYTIDGIGIYSDTFVSKSNYINASEIDYLGFIEKTYQGNGSLFDSYRGLPRQKIYATDFTVDPLENEYYLYTTVFPLSSEEDLDSISIESNYTDMPMYYSTNDVSWTAFTGKVSFSPSADFYVLQIRVRAQDVTRSFIINIFPMFDNKISTRTPAELTPNGGPFYPDTHSSSIVNFPEGVELYDISYEGVWIDDDSPKTIEILFMPRNNDKTIVFYSADGSASCGTSGSITGFTAYLNGDLVTDLDEARINQWNHLVLTKASTSATEFYLNSNASRTETNIIEYSFIAAYPTELSADTASQLYAILSSYHSISLIENPSDITESEADGTSPFKVYTYAWAIIGGGGI